MIRVVLSGLALNLFLPLYCASEVYAQSAQEQSAVVRIFNNAVGKRGSGFVTHIDYENARAYIVTAFHVVEADNKPTVEFLSRQGDRVESVVVRQQREIDLALLAVPAASLPPNTKPLSLGPVTALEVSRAAYVVGSPRAGAPWSVLTGNIQATYGATILFSGQIAEGVSGGPLLQGGIAIGLVTGRGDEARGLPASAVSAGVITEFLRGAWGSERVSSEFSFALQGLRTQEFRTGLLRLVEQAPRRFRDIRGAYKGYSRSSNFHDYDSEVALPGEEDFPELTVYGDGSMASAYYSFGLSDSEAERYYTELIRTVRATLGEGWLTKTESDSFTASQPKTKVEVIVSLHDLLGVRLKIHWED